MNIVTTKQLNHPYKKEKNCLTNLTLTISFKSFFTSEAFFTPDFIFFVCQDKSTSFGSCLYQLEISFNYKLFKRNCSIQYQSIEIPKQLSCIIPSQNLASRALSGERSHRLEKITRGFVPHFLFGA